MKIRRILLISKKTAYTYLTAAKGAGEKRMRHLLDAGHDSVARIKPAHDAHLASLRTIRREIRARDIEFTEKHQTPKYPVKAYDLIVTVGGDGTLLNASHAIRGQTPILGVNSAPVFSVGFLTGCRAPTFPEILDRLLRGDLKPTAIARLQVRIGKRTIKEPVLNDVLFSADNPALTARYRLILPKDEEVQRSSGIWIATAAGSTAALRSAGGPVLGLTEQRFSFVVREPYAPPGANVRLCQGTLGRDEPLLIESRISNASLFLDGAHKRYPLRFGETVSFQLHPKPLWLVREKAA